MHKIKLILLLILPLSVLGQDLGIIDTKTTKNPAINGTHRISTDGKNLFFRNFFGLSKKVASTDSAVFTGTTVLPSNTTIGNVSATELTYLDGVTSPIQTQLNTKLDINTANSTYAKINSPTIGYFENVDLMNPSFYSGFNYVYSTSQKTVFKYVAGSGFLADRLDVIAENIIPESTTIDKLLQTQINNKLDISTASSTYATQTALNLKANIASPTFTGNVTLPNSVRVGGTISSENNTYLGKNALPVTTSFGVNNTAIGSNSSALLQYGNNNTSVGYISLGNSVDGTSNTAIGVNSLGQNTTGSNNTGTGLGAGRWNTTGANNTYLGYETGNGITTGSGNTVVGASIAGWDDMANYVLIGSGGKARLVLDGTGKMTLTGYYRNSNALLRLNTFGEVVKDSSFAPLANPTFTGTLTAPTIANSLGANFATSSGFVGINTTTNQGYKLDINGTLRTVNDAYFATTSGNVGIGTTTPSQKLSVVVPTGTSIPTSGSAGGHQILSNGTYGMMFGVNNSGNGWIQAARTDAIATNYNLLLNPNGGNVGIGTASPAYLLDISKPVGGGWISSRIVNTSDGAASLILQNGLSSVKSWTLNTSSVASGDFDITQGINGSGTSRLYINSSGNIGIGTTAPSAKLTVAGTGGTSTISLTETGVRNYAIRSGGYGTNVFDIADLTAGASRFVINSTGNVGINTGVDLGYKLDVNGSVRTVNDAYFATTSGNVGIGTTAPNASSILDITSTTQGVLFPRMTTTQISAIASPADGLTVYNTTLKTICFYDAGAAVWKKVSHSNM